MLLVKEGNSRVYDVSFFKKVKEIMKPGALFVIWSCNHDENLFEKMREFFSDCRVEEVIEEHNNRQVPYYLYFAH